MSLVNEKKEMNNSTHEKLLGVKIDSKLSFNTHVDDICKKAGLKLNTSSRITPHLNFKKNKSLINIFFMSHFTYCQLIWVGQNRTNSNKINTLHERCLRLLYNDKKSSFHEILERDSCVSIHHRNLRALSTEIYRIYNGMAPEIVTEIFPLRQQGQCNPRNWSDFTLPNVRIVNCGRDSIRYLSLKIWESIPANIKEVDTIKRFK